MQKINKLYKKLSKVNYGWYDKKNNLHKNLKDGNFLKNYQMQDIKSIYDNNYGICWELCEVERNFFENEKIPFKTIFAVIKNNKRYACHTFLIFYLNHYYYWFEASWDKMKGIKQYDSVDEIFEIIKDNFQDFVKTENYDKNKIDFYIYKRPKKNIKCNPFYYHCMLFGKKIKNTKKIFN